MVKSGKYNEIDKKFIPVLKPGEVAIYVSCGNSIVEGVAKYPTIYLPNKDTINHPDENMPGVVDIAFITQGAPEGRDPIFGQIVFEPTEKGVITLTSSSTLDARRYAYMELCDYNGSKENRDETKPIYFYRRKPGQRAEDAFTKARKAAEALDFAQNTPIEELKKLLTDRKLRVNNLTDPDIRLLALEEATKNPFKKVAVVEKAVAPAKTDLVLTIGNLAEMFESDMLKWSVADKCIVNTETGTKYEVPGIVQTDKLEVKQKKMLEFLLANDEAGQVMTSEMKSALG